MEAESTQVVPEELPPEHRGVGPSSGSSSRDSNVVYVGKKGIMSYVLAVVTQFNAGANEVKIKARGKAISRAVDVSQIVKNRFMKDLKISMADVSTEELTSEDGSMNRVSSLTLSLTK